MSLLLDKTYEIGEETIYNYASSKTKKKQTLFSSFVSGPI